MIGTTTAGAVLPSLVEILPTGGALVYVVSNFQTPNGTVLEGRGVIPDIVVQLTRAGLLGGHDAPLERAKEVIRARKIVASSERTQPNKSLQVSRDCLGFIKPLFSQLVATRAAASTQTFGNTS